MKRVDRLLFTVALLVAAWGVVTVAQSHPKHRECVKFGDEYHLAVPGSSLTFVTRDCVAWR